VIVVQCRACGEKNRIQPLELTEGHRCDSCKNPEPPVTHPLPATSRDLVEIGEVARVPILTVFVARSCAHSSALLPHLARIAEKLSEKALVLLIDVEVDGTFAMQAGVRGTPTYFVSRKKRMLLRHEGAAAPGEIERWLKEAARA
jgi:thioredoxin-like negative regulator of GroEL